MYIYSYITLILTFSRTNLLQKCLVYDKMIFFAQKEKGVMTIINYDTIGIPSRNVELGQLTLTSGTGNGNVVCWSCVLPWIIWFSSVYIMHIVKRKFKLMVNNLTNNNFSNSLSTKKTTTYDIRNPSPGLGQA